MDWKKAAERVARQVPKGSLQASVLAWVGERSEAGRGPWVLGFSGGADSLMLVLLVWAHWPERREQLVSLHFNHRLRGRESAGDARFCAAVARGLGIRHEQGAWARPEKAGGEARARAARIQFIDTAMQGLGASVFWTGHQADDVAETMFMRLARGSGTGGLCAPRPVHEVENGRVNLRPLLGLGKARIGEILSEAGVSWREDSSNGQAVYLRNRMRSEVLPEWQAASGGRDALAGAVLSRDLLEEDDRALEAWVEELAPLKAAGCLDLKVLKGKPKAVWRRAVYRWLLSTPYRGDLSRQGFETILAAAMKGWRVRHSLGQGGFAVVREGELVWRGGGLRQRRV